MFGLLKRISKRKATAVLNELPADDLEPVGFTVELDKRWGEALGRNIGKHLEEIRRESSQKN